MSRWSQALLRRAPWLAVAVCLAAAAMYAAFYRALPAAPEAPAPAATVPAWPDVRVPDAASWSVFRGTGAAQAPSSLGPLGQRFRLAGTFFSFSDGASGAAPYCKAILDDLARKEQCLVKEGDTVEDVEVVRILRDRVVLRSQGQEEELRLSFADGAQPGSGGGAGGSLGEAAPLEVNRFGKRVGDNRWVLTRDELLKYYQEMKDDPERVALLYDSLKPDYQDGVIRGYHLDIEGEGDFFKAAGLQQGDIVRKVNSMNMTSQSRAEYFIGEFVNNRVSAIVLDIERDGASKKLIYLIR